MEMIEETIRTEFEALKNDFETIRQQIENEEEIYKILREKGDELEWD